MNRRGLAAAPLLVALLAGCGSTAEAPVADLGPGDPAAGGSEPRLWCAETSGGDAKPGVGTPTPEEAVRLGEHGPADSVTIRRTSPEQALVRERVGSWATVHWLELRRSGWVEWGSESGPADCPTIRSELAQPGEPLP